jgi:hypothetical protein
MATDRQAQEIVAHRLAEEIVRRWQGGEALGTPSLYNVAREVLVEAFMDDRGEDLADAILAVQRKVGVDGSDDPESLDYRVTHLEDRVGALMGRRTGHV